MEVQIKAKDLKVTQELRDYLQERVNKLDRFTGRVTGAKLELAHEHHRTGGDAIRAELTIMARHTLLRAEEQHADARRAIDLAVDKMARQIRRYHDKRTRRHRASLTEFVTLPELSDTALKELAAVTADMEAEEEQEIVRTKRFALKPMSSGEAIDQLELLGHDFFVFLNADDHNQVNVLYRRRRGDYGLIQPELD